MRLNQSVNEYDKIDRSWKIKIKPQQVDKSAYEKEK